MSARGDQAASVDLVRLLESYGHRPVWRSKDGDKAVFHVPWRVDRHPSLTVYRRGSVWFWTDHARQESGTTIQAMQYLHGLDRNSAISALLGDLGKNFSHQTAGGRTPKKPEIASGASEQERRRRILEARKSYEQASKAMTAARTALLAKYWRERGLTTVPEIGAVYLELPAGERMRPYMGIPLPSPEKVRSIECRLLDGRTETDRAHRARTIGPKELWVQWRDRSRLVITESILDALSYPELWPDRSESLVALNGVGNIRLLPSLVEWARQAGHPIKDVLLALDADEAGRQAAEKAAACLKNSSIRIYRVDDHSSAGVKDLHKLLLIKNNNEEKDLSEMRRLA